MIKLRADVTVLSLSEQVRLAELRNPNQRGTFEVLVRHFLDRLLTNEALGEDTALRITQLAYAIALPGLIVAMFLFPAYHGIPPGPRPYWSQACDHLFYVMYALMVMGAVTLFQWELLFPDVTDVYVLTSLPLRPGEQLMGRAIALVLFLGAVLVGTNFLGALFFPAVADLKGMWWRHLAAHCIAVTACGTFAAALFIAMQGLLVCALGTRIFRRISAMVQALALAVLLMVFFLFPVLAHFLKTLISSGTWHVMWFPPFWFLGIYERMLWGRAALPLFGDLAKRGLLATGVAIVIAAAAYPLAYAYRVRQLIEGGELATRMATTSRFSQALLHRWILRRPEGRGVYHLISLTLARSQRLQLYLAMYGGVGLALVVSGMMLFRVGDGPVRLSLSIWGLRSAAPVVAFWAVLGLRTALASPIGRAGRWVFGVIGGRPKREQVAAAKLWALLTTLMLTLTTQAIAFTIAPVLLRSARPMLTQLLMDIALCALLTDFFFRNFVDIPFTGMRVNTTMELPLIFVRYLFTFPALMLLTVSFEERIETSWTNLLIALLVLSMARTAMVRLFDRWCSEQHQSADRIEDDSLAPGLGLRG